MSGINIGAGEASAIKIGGTNATAVYAGTHQVWPMKTPPVSDYPSSASVGYKKHGHSYGYRDIDPSYVDWAARHYHKITYNVTSGYSCVAADGNAVPMTKETVYLVEYKVRARAYQQGDSAFSADVGALTGKNGSPKLGIQSSWGNSASSTPNLYSSGKERVLRWTASTSSGGAREADGDEIDFVEPPENQALLDPEARAYTIYSKFRTLVRKTGPGNFGKNEEKIWDSWTTRVPGTSGDHTKWREAEGAFYLTVPALSGYSFQPAVKSSLGTSTNGATGMYIIFDKLTFTPVTEEDHI